MLLISLPSLQKCGVEGEGEEEDAGMVLKEGIFQAQLIKAAVDGGGNLLSHPAGHLMTRAEFEQRRLLL